MGKEPSVENQLKAVMEFYVRSYFDANKEKFFEHARKMNIYGIDPDIVESKANAYLDEIIEEASSKFHDIAFIILQALTKLDEGRVRSFELRFIDLMERTLLKDAQGDMVHSVVVIADPNVGSEENNN